MSCNLHPVAPEHRDRSVGTHDTVEQREHNEEERQHIRDDRKARRKRTDPHAPIEQLAWFLECKKGSGGGWGVEGVFWDENLTKSRDPLIFESLKSHAG